MLVLTITIENAILAAIEDAARVATTLSDQLARLGIGAYRAGDIDQAVNLLKKGIAVDPLE